MNPLQPLISVCVPAYNAASYIEALVASVLKQDYPNWELVIADDCSKDSTRTILDQIACKNSDPRIRISFNEKNLGMVGNWNQCVKLARGEFIKVMGCDDLLEPGCLSRQVAAFLENPSVKVVSSRRYIINHESRLLFSRASFSQTGIYPGKKVCYKTLASGTNPIGEPVSVLFRKTDFEKIGKFDSDVVYCTDLEFWLRLLLLGDLFFINEPLCSFRIHERSCTRSLESIMILDYLRMVKKLRNYGISLSLFQKLQMHFNLRTKIVLRGIIYRLWGREKA